MPLAEGKGGEIRTPSSTSKEIRFGPYSDLIVNDSGYGRLFESTRNGRVFTLSAAAAGVAPAAANVSPLAAGTGQPLVGIYNPPGSNKAAAILGAGFGAVNVVTTQTSSIIVWNIIPTTGALITAAASGTIVGARLDGSTSVMRSFVNTALTGSTAATMFRALAANSQVSTNPAVALAVTTVAWEDTAGGIIVLPGAFAGLAAHAAGATLYACNMAWVELDWPL